MNYTEHAYHCQNILLFSLPTLPLQHVHAASLFGFHEKKKGKGGGQRKKVKLFFT
jgi:hypothetical protein